MINNEQLSRLAINFKAISEHPAQILSLSTNRFLTTNNPEQNEASAETIDCIKNTYNALDVLLTIPPNAATNIDFKVYAELIRSVVDWSQTNTADTGYDCPEKQRLLSKMAQFQSFVTGIEKNETENAQKVVTPRSSDELFAFENGTPKKRNVLLILTDEQKALTGHESPETKEFIENLPGIKKLKEEGINFKGHHTAANACRPARGVLATSQHSDLTGLDETEAVSKDANHPEIRALPKEIPTIGSYFQAAEYESIYIGKQHIIHGDVVSENAAGQPEVKASKPVNGDPDPEVIEQYNQANPLGEYGWGKWRGPDPHGANPNNAAFNRDPDYTQQFKEYIANREATKTDQPFFATLSLVNPHDIVYYPFAWLYFIYKHGFPTPGSDVTSIPINLSPSMGDNLDDKPSIQEQYRQQYAKAFAGRMVNGSYNGPLKESNPFNIWYQRFYLFFQKLADQEIEKLTKIAREHDPDIVIAVTSDHGDMSGAHGLLQKWHSAYKEEIEVPLVISHPDFVNKGKEYEGLSSHADVLPTLLKVAGLNQDELLEKLKKTHSEAHPPVGKPIGDKRDYPELNTTNIHVDDAVFFTTSDSPMNNGDTRSLVAQACDLPGFLSSKVDGVHGNTKIEMVEAYLTINGKKGHYVYSTYRPNPKDKKMPAANKPQFEEEFYVLKGDKYQRKNFIHDKKLAKQDKVALSTMKKLLAIEKVRNLRVPNDPSILTRPEHHRQLIPKQKLGNDLRLFLLAPPALLLLLASYLVFHNRHKIINAAPKLAAALTAFGLYRQYQKHTATNKTEIKPSTTDEAKPSSSNDHRYDSPYPERLLP